MRYDTNNQQNTRVYSFKLNKDEHEQWRKLPLVNHSEFLRVIIRCLIQKDYRTIDKINAILNQQPIDPLSIYREGREARTQMSLVNERMTYADYCRPKA